MWSLSLFGHLHLRSVYDKACNKKSNTKKTCHMCYNELGRHAQNTNHAMFTGEHDWKGLRDYLRSCAVLNLDS